MEGTVLWQNYYIYKDEIGSGTYSKVYKAFDTTTNDFVAIKKLNKSKLSKHLIQRFLKEIDILKSINHPNIVKFKNSLVTDKYIFIITEYCDGGSISDLIDSKELQEKDVQHIIYQLVSAMNYLDSIHIVHRDIKPDNLLITKGMTLKMIDFGFSYQNKMEDELYTTLCGTPMYMSPELLMGLPYTKKSDLWSLGVIAYELFHSRNPYGKPRNIQELLQAVRHTEVLYRSDISPHFLDFLGRLLLLDPAERIDYDQLAHHPWFHNPIISYKNIHDDLFDMDDIDKSEKVEYLTMVILKAIHQNEHMTVQYTDNFESVELSQLSERETSHPIDITKKHIKIIDNFFEKPNTFIVDSGSPIDIYKRPISESLLSLPIRMVKTIIKNSPIELSYLNKII
jgi:serine/threonine protein kinase